MPPVGVGSQPQKLHKLYLDKYFQIICAVSLIAVLGVASVTPAFPKLAEALEVAPQNVGWLVTAFTFPTMVLGPVIGVLADRSGRKKILVPALFLFGIAGAACAVAPNFAVLLLLRFLQGIGAAPLLSLSVTLIGDLYAGEKRTTAMGYNASVSSIGTAIYPTIGGALATLGWNYPFFLPLVAIPIGLLVLFILKSPEPQGERNLREYLRNALNILKNRQIVGLFIGSAANFILLYGAYVTYLPTLIDDSFKASALTIGLILSSVSVAIAFTSSQLGRLARRFSEGTLIRASFVFYALALLIVPFLQSLWLLLIPTTLFGVGLGIGMPSIQTLLAELAPREYLATVMSINGTFFGLGQTLGPLIMGIAFGIGGISSVFYVGVAFAFLTLVVFRYCNCM
ncbi:MFS transporter [Microcoleus sp. FACHB-SPT15]|uniref:MFS transporter n=1 Tax=Microcoleus sp. FACHB-SPT15 TaxID=2692830 RepID=UPI00177E4C8E|nr:MFS transporter [Microcoleus sp. FACHB-SPT15]MBD1804986.1 MFS transporter [Microcoleus sp. FACHB-SPT15]